MNPAILSVQQLHISLQQENSSRAVIDAIDFDIYAGQTFALVGESGSGKSITARAIMQLLDAKTFQQQGKIFLRKKNGSSIDVIKAADAERFAYRGHDAGMIFQEPMSSLNPVMRIGKQITEALITHQKMPMKVAKQKAIEWLHKVQLPHPELLFNRYPHELSGGQKQRVMIAIAMCNEPALLIADEPTTALDSTTQKEILLLLKSLQQKTGMALLFITHDLGIVEKIADEVAVMQKGKIIESGSSHTIFNHPKHTYTKILLQCRPMHYVKGKSIDVDNTERSGFKEISNLARPITTASPLLEIKNLSVIYPGKKSFFSSKKTSDYQALKNVSLDLHQGETVGIVGESGCGKTTLGRTLLGLIKPSGGEIRLNGKLYNQIPKKYKEIQIVFQDPYSSLNPRLQIGATIEEPLMTHRHYYKRSKAKEYAVDLLEKVKLQPDLYHRYPHQLSGGQRQRLVIARALALQPDLIIYDESVSALDVSIQAQILNLLNDLKSDHKFSSLFISHDLSVVKYISDRMYVMRQGMIVEHGTPEEIWLLPKHPYTKMLIEAII
jgi:peptide/nickel transport system ATP-binding protein